MFAVVLAHLVGDRPALIVSLTADPTSSGDIGAIFLTYGPLGIFVGLWVTGQISSKFEVRRMEKQYERQIGTLEAENKHLHDERAAQAELIRAFQMQLTGQTLPALAQATRVFDAVPTAESEALAQMRRVLSDLTKQIESLGKGETP